MAGEIDAVRNHLLASLEEGDRQEIAARARVVSLAETLASQESGNFAYFPLDGLVSVMTVLDDGNMVEAALVGGVHGEAGATILLEEHLEGPEASVFAVTDGRTVLPLAPARDHKRVGDGDTGPNTGGMGAFSPLPDVDDDLVDEVRRTILEPTVAELARRGARYQGLLYAGLILTAGGPRVLEFNCRFGDPETQVILPRMTSDLADLAWAVAFRTQYSF